MKRNGENLQSCAHNFKQNPMRYPGLETRFQRRRFIQNVAGLSGSILLQNWRAFGEVSQWREIRVFTTSETRKHAEGPPLRWKSTKGVSPTTSDAVEITSTQRFQPMLGFGCAYTDASCFLLSRMDAAMRQGFLTETFSPDRMGLNVGRTTIGASDYSRNVYSYDDVANDVSMEHFSIAHDEEYILPMLREMRRLNPELFLLSTPWSPPGWMKTYGSMLGGWMTSRYLEPYSRYFGRFLDAYKAAGVEINAVTSQNEVETDQAGHMPATYWTPEMESDFIREYLGPLLRKKKSKTEIWLLDHNYELWKRVRWQLQDPELRQYVAGVAWHGYVGTPDQMSRLHEVVPEMPFYWTEGGPDITDPKYALDWTRWGTVFTSAIKNWCRCIITWNLMLDERGEPNIGPFSCGGLVTLRGGRELEYSGQYWALRHLSQHVKRGAVRLGSHSDASELSHVAMENRDGSSVLMLTNTGDERELQMIMPVPQGRVTADVRLDRNSISTVIW